MTIFKGVATGILLFVVFMIVDWWRMTRMAAANSGGGAISIDLHAYSAVMRYILGIGLGVLLGAGGFLALTKALEVYMRKLPAL